MRTGISACLPAYPFYGGPAVNPDVGRPGHRAQLIKDMDTERTGRALSSRTTECPTRTSPSP